MGLGALNEASNATGVYGYQSNNGVPGSGAAYVFMRGGTSWSQQAYLKASNTGSTDYFGVALALSESMLIIGASGEDSSATGVDGDQTSNATSDSGAAYVFERTGSVWVQQAYLKASNTGFNDAFGRAVAIADDVALVSAPLEDSNAVGSSGDESNNSATEAGAAYVFVRSSMGWEQESYVKASNTGAFDVFGWSVGLSGNTALLGGPTEDSAAVGVNGDETSNSAAESGAAYVLQIGPEAVVIFRNAGSNPPSYAADPLVVGSAFTATVDNNVASQATSLLFAFDSPITLTLGGGQTLLCIDLGSGELFTGSNLAPTSSASGVDS